MNKLISGAVVAVALAVASTANAADIARPVYKAPVVVPAFNWSGFYIGAHAGWGWQKEQGTLASLTPAFPLVPLGTGFNVDKDGFLGGATVGINWQPVGQPWVFGIEGEWSWSDADQSAAVVFPGAIITGYAKANWYATAAGRLGYAWDRSLFYVKGGAAWMDSEYYATALLGGPLITSPTFGNTRTGWMVGVGFEQAFYDNWSWKIEYNYLDFGSKNISLLVDDITAGVDIDTQVHVVKFGINYRFGYAKAPVVAKY